MIDWYRFRTEQSSELGRKEALQWLGLTLFFVVGVGFYFRFGLERVCQWFWVFLPPELKTHALAIYALYVVAVLAFVIWAYRALGRVVDDALLGPVYAVTHDSLHEHSREGLKRLIFLNGLFAIPLLVDLLFYTLPGLAGIYRIGTGASAVFLALFILGALTGGWARIDPEKKAPSCNGEYSDVALVVARVSLWANFFFAVVMVIGIPLAKMSLYRHYGIMAAMLGMLLALFACELGTKRLPYILGLVVGVGGEFAGYETSAWLFGLGVVFVVELLQGHQGKLALAKTWGFGFGQALGGLLGAPLGFFFLGLEGIALGAVFGETVMALFVFDFAELLIVEGPADASFHSLADSEIDDITPQKSAGSNEK